MRRIQWHWAMCGLLLCASGCARKPAVSADGLTLRRVVVYRNGVGYFERAGHVESDRVQFRVKGSEVGDFLATLAVMERGGSSVRAASFPIKVDDAEPAPACTPVPMQEEGKSLVPPKPPVPPAKKDKLEKVVLELDGKTHDLQVGYIAETPVWRPSYRLVVGKTDADLQAWGIVQNLSGEDWTNVSLSLIAGAPLAFEATLGTPVIPTRPVVTDTGEVIAAVPKGETTLNQQEAPPPPPAPAAAPPADEAISMADLEVPEAASKEDSKRGPKKRMAGMGGASRGMGNAEAAQTARPKMSSRAAAPGAMSGAATAFQAMAPRVSPSAPRNLSALAAIASEGGATRYDIPSPVTVPDKSATMVMLLSKRVPGESMFLFAPDGGVPDSQQHPFRVARFVNKSGGLLERGPIAVFEQGAFLGQGMLDPLPDGATATVPFALERALAVDSERSYSEEGARLASIEAGNLTIFRDAVTLSKYHARNGSETKVRLLVKHARSPGTRLHHPPKGTEDNVGSGTALVPVEVAPHVTAELVVDERQAVARQVDWLSPWADEAVRAYFVQRGADPKVVRDLQAAWEVRAGLVRSAEERKVFGDEQGELQNSTEETRRNLKALEKNKTAADLRQKLTDRLAKNALRLDELTRKLVEVDMKINEQRVRFTDMIRHVKMVDPPKPE